MTVMPITPTNSAFVRLGRAADMIAAENETLTREDVMDAFKSSIFHGDWEFPPQTSEDEARAPRRLQMEIPVPASTLPPVLQSLDLRPRAFYAVNRSTIASVMYCASALPGDHADWKRLFDYAEPDYDMDLPYRTLSAIPFRQYPDNGRHELEILLAPKATLAVWLGSHRLPVPQALGGRLLVQSQSTAVHSHDTEPSEPRDQRLQVIAAFLRDVKSILRDEIARHFFLAIGDFGERRGNDFPFIRLAGDAFHGGHHAVHAFDGVFNRRHAQGIALLDIRLGRHMTRSALQIIGHCPVIFVPKF